MDVFASICMYEYVYVSICMYMYVYVSIRTYLNVYDCNLNRPSLAQAPQD